MRKKPNSSRRIPGSFPKSKTKGGREKVAGWCASLILMAAFFSLELYPAQRMEGLWQGKDLDFKKLELNLAVDGVKASWGYSGWRGAVNFLAPNRSEPPILDHNLFGGSFNVNGTVFPHGLGVHAPSQVAFALDGRIRRFTCQVGLDESSDPSQMQGVYCYVLADGHEIIRSPLLTQELNAFSIDVPVSGVRELVLGVDTTDLEDMGSNVDWVNLVFVL